ncbi:MAG: ABC transporter permease [Alphaproteobacteria bacterium]
MTGLRRTISNVLAVAYKEAALLRHDRTLVQNVFMQPVIMLLVFGYALSFRPTNVPWAVLDRSETAASRALVAEIGASGYFEPPLRVDGYGEARRLLREGRVTAVLVVPSELRRGIERGRPEVQLLLDGTDPMTAARVSGYVTQIASRVGLRADPGTRGRGETSPAARSGPDPAVDLRQSFRFNPTLRDLDFYLSAMAGYLLTNLCLSAAALSLVAEKENGTYEQLLAQPTRPLEVVVGKLLPNIAVSYLSLTLATVGAGLLYDFWPRGNLLLVLLATLPFVLATLSIGAFVSTLARTSAQAIFIAVFFIMPSFVLSGSMLPYELMPHGVRELGGLFPLRWFQIAARRVIVRGATLGEIAVPLAVLVSIFGVMLLAIRRLMKPRLD